MLSTRFVAATLSAGMMAVGTGVVSSQEYPTKPIHIIAGSPGGGNDFTGRLIGQGISGPLGQPVVIDNIGGGSLGSVQATLRAPPDGYTMVVIGGAFWTLPLLEKTPSYNPMTDFAPITQVTKVLKVVAVHPSVPAKSIKELIALAKARPGELNFSSSTLGSAIQLANGLFKSMAGIKIVEVPYKGNVAGVAATIAGEMQVTMPDIGLALPYMKSGKLRGLAVTSATRSLVALELPTVAESGLPGYEYVGATNLLARGKTPAAIINRLNREVVRVLTSPEVKEKFLIQGEEIVADSPEHFSATISSENTKWAKVIRDAGISAQ